MWRLQSHSLLLPKAEATPAECEDAISISEERRRFAVADGATEAFDARGWAERLTCGWATLEQMPRTASEFILWATEEGARWEEDWRERKLPWYAEEKRRAGSFAAFVGIEFEDASGCLRWRAVGIGDACLVQVREGKLQSALPIADWREFNQMPRLVPSVAVRESLNESDVSITEGTVEAGDRFWLLSDALAQWCLRGLAEESGRFAELENLLMNNSSDLLAKFIEAERREARLRDDDVAAVRILCSN